ncbi:hypothetical protein L1887_58896 [Cichorium endivia]|nr:hypothetical protein L1887_58896 [Cichorium endivia]
MSAIEADNEPASSSSSATRKVLVQTLSIKDEYISTEDIETVRTVCKIVGTRAARLSATAIAATMIQTGNVQSTGPQDQGVKVGVDGSVIEFYPRKSSTRIRAAHLIESELTLRLFTVSLPHMQTLRSVSEALCASSSAKRARSVSRLVSPRTEVVWEVSTRQPKQMTRTCERERDLISDHFLPEQLLLEPCKPPSRPPAATVSSEYSLAKSMTSRDVVLHLLTPSLDRALSHCLHAGPDAKTCRTQLQTKKSFLDLDKAVEGALDDTLLPVTELDAEILLGAAGVERSQRSGAVLCAMVALGDVVLQGLWIFGVVVNLVGHLLPRDGSAAREVARVGRLWIVERGYVDASHIAHVAEGPEGLDRHLAIAIGSARFVQLPRLGRRSVDGLLRGDRMDDGTVDLRRVDGGGVKAGLVLLEEGPDGLFGERLGDEIGEGRVEGAEEGGCDGLPVLVRVGVVALLDAAERIEDGGEGRGDDDTLELRLAAGLDGGLFGLERGLEHVARHVGGRLDDVLLVVLSLEHVGRGDVDDIVLALDSLIESSRTCEPTKPDTPVRRTRGPCEESTDDMAAESSTMVAVRE